MMLPTRIGATGNADANRFVELHALFEFTTQHGRSVFGLSESELTKLNPRTRKHALSGPGGLIVESSLPELRGQCREIPTTNVKKDNILGIRRPDPPAAI